MDAPIVNGVIFCAYDVIAIAVIAKHVKRKSFIWLNF
jgi:hypothetical protein